jgi:hypothetical protein
VLRNADSRFHSSEKGDAGDAGRHSNAGGRSGIDPSSCPGDHRPRRGATSTMRMERGTGATARPVQVGRRVVCGFPCPRSVMTLARGSSRECLLRPRRCAQRRNWSRRHSSAGKHVVVTFRARRAAEVDVDFARYRPTPAVQSCTTDNGAPGTVSTIALSRKRWPSRVAV